MKPFSRHFATYFDSHFAITICMRSCAVHMGECLHTMLRMCASFFVYQNWMDEAKSAGRPEDWILRLPLSKIVRGLALIQCDRRTDHNHTSSPPNMYKP